MRTKTDEVQQAGESQTLPHSGATNTDNSNPVQEAAAPKKKKPILAIVVGVLLVLGAFYGIRYISWAKNHVATDDAQISSDLVLISPQVSGTVTKVYVTDNQVVKAGQLLVELDSATYQVDVDQAKASVDAALAQEKSADATVALTSASTDAVVTQAQAGVSQADAGVISSEADLQRGEAAVSAAKSQSDGAREGVGSAQANYQSSLAALKKAEGAQKAALAQVATSTATVRAAKAQVRSRQSTADRAKREAARYSSLLSQGAISASVADQTTTASDVAIAELQTAQDAVDQATNNLAAARANVDEANSQFEAAQAAVHQARSGILVAKSQFESSVQAVNQAIAVRQSLAAAITNAKAKTAGAKGQLSQAETGPRQVNVSQANAHQADARLETAQAVYAGALINLKRTKIYAPVSGKISRKSVSVGNLVTVGTPLMSIVPQETAWVIANFKETQLTDVKIGQPVEIELDAFPGRTFSGKVQSLSAGTGATFALLPADNATGNFTKVVQRVPVKITLDPGQADLDRLTVGMSVAATIVTKSD